MHLFAINLTFKTKQGSKKNQHEQNVLRNKKSNLGSLWAAIPEWADAVCGSVHWHTGTECSPLQPTAHPDRIVAMLSSPVGRSGGKRCQPDWGQIQRLQERTAGKPESRPESSAIWPQKYIIEWNYAETY